MFTAVESIDIGMKHMEVVCYGPAISFIASCRMQLVHATHINIVGSLIKSLCNYDIYVSVNWVYTVVHGINPMATNC